MNQLNLETLRNLAKTLVKLRAEVGEYRQLTEISMISSQPAYISILRANEPILSRIQHETSSLNIHDERLFAALQELLESISG